MQKNTALQLWEQLPSLNWEEKVAYLTYRFSTLPQTGTPVEHVFEPGVYVREMRIPAGTLFIGRAHRHGHLCQLVSGTMELIFPQHVATYSAPDFLNTLPGCHMVLHAVTDVVGRTIHPNPHESRDVEALEADIFESVEALAARGAAIQERLALT